ncbi:MAG: hypothetical protein ACEQSD_09210 [Flavobacteriales bacterium]
MKTIHQDRYGQLIAAMVKVRKNNQTTQTQLAQQLSRPQSYVAKIETLERKLDIVEFVDWCNAIGQSPSELLRAQLEQQSKQDG